MSRAQQRENNALVSTRHTRNNTLPLAALLRSAMEADAKPSQIIPMSSSHWHPVSERSDVQYVVKEGFPDGIIVLKSGDLGPKQAFLS